MQLKLHLHTPAEVSQALRVLHMETHVKGDQEMQPGHCQAAREPQGI